MTTTVNSGFWGTGYSMISGKNPIRRVIKQGFNRRSEMVDQELMLTLIGATDGSTAAASIAQVDAPSDGSALGGKRTINTVELINRATTSADTTEMKTLVAYDTGLTYPTDAARNR